MFKTSTQYKMMVNLVDGNGGHHCYLTTCDPKELDWSKGLLSLISMVGIKSLYIEGYSDEKKAACPYFVCKATFDSPLSHLQKKVIDLYLNGSSADIQELEKQFRDLPFSFTHQLFKNGSPVYLKTCRDMQACERFWQQPQPLKTTTEYDLRHFSIRTKNVEVIFAAAKSKTILDRVMQNPKKDVSWTQLFLATYPRIDPTRLFRRCLRK